MVFESHLGTKIDMKATDVHHFLLKMPSESQQGNQDLLMSLENEFHNFWDIYSGGEFFYGNKTRQIMEIIGHATRENPENYQVEGSFFRICHIVFLIHIDNVLISLLI